MAGGRPHLYDPIKLPQILESVIKAHGSLGQVADLNRINRQTFYSWIRQGDKDLEEDKQSDIAQFSYSIRDQQAKVVAEMIDDARCNSKKAQFIMWLLSRICREDFGAEGIEMKELRDLFRVILPMIGKGARIDEQELSSERT